MASFLCIAEEFKGSTFMSALKAMGHKVFLLTTEKSRSEPWPLEVIDEIFTRPDTRDQPHNRQELVEGTAWLMRNHGLDRIVALDDFDVEDAALLREEFRIPGMGQTTARHFRDKLAMRMLAYEHGIPVPAFSPLFREQQVREFCGEHEGPWVIKPRSEASAAGIRKVHSVDEAVQVFNELGDRAYRFLIEAFAPGSVYHVDALVKESALVFVKSSAYVDPPLAIVQGGGLFQTRMLDQQSDEARELAALTEQVMKAFGMRFSASHTEFIRDASGRFLLLETSSRVGGAYISNMVEHATGVDLWAEWAKLEAAELNGLGYKAPGDKGGYGAVTMRTVPVEHPDLSHYHSDVVKYTVKKRYHAGMVYGHADRERVVAEQEAVAKRLAEEFG